MTIDLVVVGGRAPEVESRTIDYHGVSVLLDCGDIHILVKHYLHFPDVYNQCVVFPMILHAVGEEAEVGSLRFSRRHGQLELFVGDHVIPESGILFFFH